jgi:hypothetical protein
MTKAKARQRAKARAAQKTKKRERQTDQPDQNIRAGKFDPGTGSIKGPNASSSAKNFGVARRGSARSK